MQLSSGGGMPNSTVCDMTVYNFDAGVSDVHIDCVCHSARYIYSAL